MKRTATVFCLIFLLIPTYLILSFLFSGRKTPISFRDITKTVITSSNSYVREINYDENNSDTTLFYRMLENKTQVASIPSGILKLTPYKVSFVSDGFTSDYEYYLSSSPDRLYIIQRSGVSVIYYKIDKEIGDEFLRSDFSEGVYASSVIPSLLIDSRNVMPGDVNWLYKAANDEFRTAKENEVSEFIPDIGALSSDFKLVFSSEPSSISLKVTDREKNELLYSGTASEFRALTVSDNLSVRIDINAVYDKGGEAYGNIDYSVYAKLYAPLYFFISEPQVKEGGVVVLSAKNVINSESLRFESEPAFDYKPVFYNDGDYYRALLPVPRECVESSLSYKLKLSADGTTKEVTLLILNSSYDSVKISGVSAGTLNSVGVKDQPYTELYAAISSTISKYTDFGRSYVSGNFSSGYEKGIHRSSYGTSIEYTKLPGKVFISEDHAYVGNKTDPITAMNNGKVVFMGNTGYTGGLIVIDHGFGLLSWYWNIGTFSSDIMLGGNVEKGALLGYNGGGGLSEQYNGKNNSCHIAVTVFDRPIDEKYLISGGLKIDNK